MSQQYTDTPECKGDGHEWTVSSDWAANSGLKYDIWSVQLDSKQEVLHTRFQKEPVFLEVINTFYNLDHGKWVCDKCCTHHQALSYQIDGGHLWHIGDGKSIRACARLECVTQEEAIQLARVQHTEGGHFGRDLTKITLLDSICSPWIPWIDKSITTAITECGRCKAFGGSHLAALLEPIMRWHPWELMIGDYLSIPMGKGGFHTIGLYMDVYSQKIFRFKFTAYRMTATTISSLNWIQHTYWMPEVFMADGRSHFAGHDVAEWCTQHGLCYQQVAAYSLWVNGLLEGTNRKLLARLKCLCTPNLGEDKWANITSFEHLLATWPTHFDTTIEQLNDCILLAYKFTPNELCLGTVVNTNSTPLDISTSELTKASITIQNEYVVQQNIDVYSHIVEHTNKRKAAFNKRVTSSRDGVIK